MKKILLALMLVIGLTACDNKETTAPEGKPTIKIGAILPLSGNIAEPGVAAQKSLELTLEKLSKRGLKYNYELIFEDNQMSPQKTATASNKLLNMDKVDAIFSMWNMAGNIVASFTNQKEVFGFSCSYGEKSTEGKYNYNFLADLNVAAEKLSSELKKRNISKVALFTSNGHVELTDAILKAFEKNNITLTFNEMANWGGTDFRIAIVKAQKTNPEQYVILDITPAPYVFMKQLKEITGRNDNVTTIDTFAEMTFDTRPIAEGLWFVEIAYKEPSSFTKELLKEKKVKANSCTAPISAELEIFINAVENAEVEDGETLPSKDSINKWIWANVKDYPTVAGTTTIINEGLFHTEPSVKMIKNKEVVYYIEEK